MPQVIQTVLGFISPDSLGRTLTHEHLSLDYGQFYVPPPIALNEFFTQELSIRNAGLVQRYPYSHRSNLSISAKDSEDALLHDLAYFKNLGGNAIVENTNHGLRRDAGFLKKLSELSGVQVIAGTGFYLASVQPEDVLSKSIEEICEVMIRDLSEGCVECEQVKCGFIGEVASDFPLHRFEVKTIEATGALQDESGCPVSFHPGRDAEAPTEIMRIYTEAGGDPKKAVMSHLDRTFATKEQLLEFAQEFECFLQFDLFGTEVLTYQFAPTKQMPSDYLRIKRIERLIREGFSHRILMSHDVHTKNRLLYYGGHGFLHLLGNVAPKMSDCGISREIIDEITIRNPSEWLSWDPLSAFPNPH